MKKKSNYFYYITDLTVTSQRVAGQPELGEVVQGGERAGLHRRDVVVGQGEEREAGRGQQPGPGHRLDPQSVRILSGEC